MQELKARSIIQFYRFQNAALPVTYVFQRSQERENTLANFPVFRYHGAAWAVEIQLVPRVQLIQK